VSSEEENKTSNFCKTQHNCQKCLVALDLIVMTLSQCDPKVLVNVMSSEPIQKVIVAIISSFTGCCTPLDLC
jgi:hypothetical protein